MEGLTRLVSESLARHGFDRPLDYRRLRWSRWFRCESAHSLLFVPSKPGVFALAEEIMDLGSRPAEPALSKRSAPKGTSENSPAFQRRDEASSEEPRPSGTPETAGNREGYDFSRTNQTPRNNSALAAEGPQPRRMLAVSQFFDTDDMAFTLDRMVTRNNPMRSRLASGRYFIRFVVIEDHSQRLSISAALNQWIANSAEKVSAIGAHFATSLEFTDTNADVAAASAVPPKPSEAEAHVGADAFVRPASAASMPAIPGHTTSPDTHDFPNRSEAELAPTAAPMTLKYTPTSPQLDSGAASNLHCPSPLPSGF